MKLNNLYLYTKVFKVMNMYRMFDRNYNDEKQELHDYHFVQYTFIVDATDQEVTPFN